MNRFPAAHLATASAAIMALSATPAMAAGTTAGTQINNRATINYQVNTIPTSATAAASTVTVDRVVRFTVSQLTTSPITVYPGDTNVSVAFRIGSTSNAPISFSLTGSNTASDTFSVQNLRYYWDQDGNGIFEALTDTEYTASNSPVINPDTNYTFFIVADIPSDVAKDAIDTLLTSVTAMEPNTTGNQSTAIITAAIAGNTTGVDTVLVDSASTQGDAVNNGTVQVDPTLQATAKPLSSMRMITIISDPVNGTTKPRYIPGAVVEYCIAVSNASDTKSITDLTIEETLGANQTFDSTFGIYQGGTVTNGVCDTTGSAGGSQGGSFDAGKVSATLGSIAPSASKTIRYRTTID